MSEENFRLLVAAKEGRSLYKSGLISREEMKKMVMPFIDNYNKIAVEVATKYNMKPRKINLASYLRSNY